MPKYIDVDKTLNRLPNDLPYKSSVKRVLLQAPEADVVPKSEVERLLDEIDGWFMYCEDYSGHLIKTKLAELKKKYTEDRK